MGELKQKGGEGRGCGGAHLGDVKKSDPQGRSFSFPSLAKIGAGRLPVLCLYSIEGGKMVFCRQNLRGKSGERGGPGRPDPPPWWEALILAVCLRRWVRSRREGAVRWVSAGCRLLA